MISFDELKSRALDLTQSGVAKAKELTDVALLAVEIAKYKDTPAEAAKAIADYFNGTSKKE